MRTLRQERIVAEPLRFGLEVSSRAARVAKFNTANAVETGVWGEGIGRAAGAVDLTTVSGALTVEFEADEWGRTGGATRGETADAAEWFN